jgi:hypothetical protein
MEKHISIWSYRLGLVCAVLTIVLRGLACFGIYPNIVPQAGASVSYNTFLRGAVMLLVLSIASGLLSGGSAKS